MAGKRSRYRMRCNTCRRKGGHGQFTLRRNPYKYIKEPKCPNCDSTEVVSVEAKYRRAKAKEDKCFCPGVPHPHRRASHKMCEHSNFDVSTMDEDDWYSWEANLNNRSRTSSQ